MGSPLGIKVKLKLDNKDIEKYIQEIQSNGINIDINNFSQINNQFKEVISNINQLKELNNLKIIDNVQITDLKEVISMLKEVNRLNKGIKINFINNTNSSNIIPDNNKMKEQLTNQKKLIKNFAKKIGVSYNDELVQAIKGNFNGGGEIIDQLVSQHLNNISKKTSNKLKKEILPIYKDAKNYIKGLDFNINPKDFDEKQIKYLKKSFDKFAKISVGKIKKPTQIGFDNIQEEFSNRFKGLVSNNNLKSMQDFAMELADIINKYRDIKNNIKLNNELTPEEELKYEEQTYVKITNELNKLYKSLNNINAVKEQLKNVNNYEYENEKLKEQNDLIQKKYNLVQSKDKYTYTIPNNINKISKKFDIDENGNKNLSKQTKEWTNELGQTVKIVQKVNQETGKLEDKVEIINENYKKQAKEREKVLQEEQKIRNKIEKMEDKEFEKEHKNVYTEAEKSIKNQIALKKRLIKSKDLETETLKNNLKLEEEKYNKLKMELDIADRIKLTKNKDELQRTKVEPLVSRELDKELEKEQKNIEKIENKIALSKKKIKKEEMQDEEKQAKEINKLLENNWKKIESFKRQQTESLGDMAYKYKGLYKTKEIEQFRKELSKLSPTSETIEKDIDKLRYKIKDFKNELKTRNDMYKLGKNISSSNNNINMKSNDNEIKRLVENIGGVNAEIQKIDNTPILKNGNEIKKINYRVKEGKDKWHEYQLSIVQAVDGGKVSLRQLDRGLKDVTNRQMGWAARFKHAWMSVLSFAGVSGLFFGLKRAIDNGIRSIIELDSAITDLKKVTDESNESYKNFIISANEMAIAVGHSTKAAIEATTEFAKLGFTMKESGKLAKEALIYSNIGDVDINSATKSIISTMKGFNITADKTRHILDASNEVGNNFAITTGGIGEALQNSASSLSEANNTFEQSIGLITAGNASVQDPKKVGNALKTISMRLRGIKEDSGETIPKLKEVIKSITDVDIMKDENTFKSTYKILVDISKVWDHINDKDRATLLEKIAGKRQGNVLASILNNMEDGIKATDTAINSANSAAQEQEKYMESINGKINKFKENVMLFWNKLIESKTIKNIIDLGTKFIKVLDCLFNRSKKVNLGFILLNSGILGMIKSYRTFLSSMVFVSDKTGKATLKIGQNKIAIRDLGKAITTTSTQGVTFGGVIQLLKNGFNALKTSAIWAKIAVLGVKAVLTVGLSVLITVATSFLTEIVEKIVEAKKPMKELVSIFQDSVQQNNSNIQSLSKMSDEYEKLKNKTYLSVQEQEKLNDMNNNLAQMFPELVTGYDNQGNAIVNLKGNLQDYIKILEKKNKLEALKFLDKGEEGGGFKKAFREAKKHQKEIKNINNAIRKSKNGQKRLIDMTGSYNKQAKEVQRLTKNHTELKNELQLEAGELDEVEQHFQRYKQSLIMTNDNFNKLNKNTQNFISNYINNIKVSDFDSFEQATNIIKKLINSLSKNSKVTEIVKQITELNQQAQTGKIKNYEQKVGKLIDKLAKVGKIDPKILSKIFKFDISNLREANGLLGEAVDKMKESTENFKNAMSNMDFYKTALKELDKKKQLSPSSISTIIEEHDELIPLLLDEKALYKKLSQAMVDEKQIAINAIMVKLEGNEIFFHNVLQKNENLVNQLKNAYDADLENFKTMAQAKSEVVNLLAEDSMKQWAKSYKTKEGALQGIVSAYEKGQKLEKEGKYNPIKDIGEEQYKKAKALLALNEEWQESIEDARKSFQNLKLTEDEANKTIKESTRIVNQAKEAIKEYEMQIKKLNTTLNEQEYITEKCVKGSKKRQEALKQEIEILKQQLGIYKEGMDLTTDLSSKLYSEANMNGQQVTNIAERYLGTPYVWGGESTSGFDCSGLVQYVFDQLNIQLNRTSQEQVKQGIAVSKNELQSGDLVFFGDPNAPHHVGIYMGDGKFIHAPHTGDVVKISNLDNRSDYATARRIIIENNSGNNISESSFNANLQGVLKGHADEFIQAGKEYGVDPYLIAAISMFESGRGTSDAIINHNNPSGVMDWDNNYNTIRHFNSLQEGINFATKNLKDLYISQGLTTIDQIGGKYAPIGANNDLNGTNKDWTPSVKSIYQEISGGLAFTGENHNLINQAQEMESKYEQYKNNILEIKKQIEQKYKAIYEDQITLYENKIQKVDEKIKQINLDSDVEIKNSPKIINTLKEITKYNSNKLLILQQQKKFIEEEIKNVDDVYSEATIQEMNKKTQELNTSIKEVVKTVKDISFQWVDTQLKNINERIQENVELINNAINRIENSKTKDLVQKMQLKSQLIEIDKQNIQELIKLIQEVSKEQKRTNNIYLFEKLKELNVELDKTRNKLQQNKKELEDIKNSMASLISDMEDKIKQVIQKNNEIFKDNLQKRLKLFEEAVDKQVEKLEEAEKRINHNETVYDDNKKIFELQAKLNRLSLDNSIEGKNKKIEIEKKLNEAIRHQKDNQIKYEINKRKENLQKAKDEYNKYLQEYDEKTNQIQSNENLTLEAAQALKNGYITDLNGNRIDLENALIEFENKTNQGLSNIGNKIKVEIIDNLNQVKDILKSFNTLDVTKIEPNQLIKRIYGSGMDLENAKKILGIKGYKYIDTNMIDNDKIQLNPNDLIVGGEKVALNRQDLNGALRLAGKDRVMTKQIVQLYKDIQDGKIPMEQSNVYGSGADLSNAKKWLKMFGYNFIDTATTQVSPSDIDINDIVVGGKLAKNGINFGVNDRLGGINREATDKAIHQRFLKLVNEKLNKYYKDNSLIGTVYGSGADLSNAKKYLSNFGYKFVKTKDVRDKNLKANDIVVGGEGVIQGKDNILNNNIKWLRGVNRQETEESIKKYAQGLNDILIDTKGFSDGGVVDFTGYAKVHGGNGHNELFLNNSQATNLYNFIKNIPNILKDNFVGLNTPVFEGIDMHNFPIDNSKQQNKEDYYININIEGDLKATDEEASKFAHKIVTQIRKKR